ncbi:MAG: O-antigen ligase domain-containing protein [Pseudonocardia sp.]|uniref:O-antigen ligase domain-containing protein n=1 Tax=Pseudonocardia sp. TaxID=60912 RepID=UPI001AC51BAE|nr:O-antigen ligase domain-containing protein [Pseudonocardia sp.]MBN9100018.1 O-antigen ligase domain-containing protein [Pseudonocardia sp.]
MSDAVSAAPRVPRLVGLAWGFLLVNTLGFNASTLIIPFPHALGQVVTMGLLLAAFAIALVLNPRIRLRPSVYLVLLTLLALVATASSLRLESGLGSLLRCFRLLVFVATLWLLSVWWRADLRFVRFHLRALVAVLSTVLAGLAISPGAAFSGPDGRLVGALWPIAAPQVGMYGAVAIGLSVLMWLHRGLDGRSALVISVPAAVLLLLSHTRTAMLGLVVALLAAGLSSVFTEGRVRRFLGTALGLGATGAVLFGAAVQTWLLRGQDSQQLASLTGRANVWDALLSRDRSVDELVMGVGLTDKSFDGLPIDSAWLSAYNELGWSGVVIVVLVLGSLLVTAALKPPSPQRTIAIFLVVYSCVASYTEVGLSDASPYLLNLFVAAALIAVPIRQRTPL